MLSRLQAASLTAWIKSLGFRFQVSEYRSQKTEDGRQRTEVRGSSFVVVLVLVPRPRHNIDSRGRARGRVRKESDSIASTRPAPFLIFRIPHSNFPGPDLVYKDCLSRWQLLRRSGWVSMIEAVAPGRAESLKPETSYETS
jgi:hypothetical protein